MDPREGLAVDCLAQAHHMGEADGRVDPVGLDLAPPPKRTTARPKATPSMAVTTPGSAVTSRTTGAAGKRSCLPNARVMIHQPLGGSQGQASDIEIYANEILRLRSELNGILSHHTGQDIEAIEKDTNRDNFMSAQEAKEYGLVDEVIEKRS